MLWQILPGKLWQGDLLSPTEMRVECVVTCTRLGLSSVLVDVLHAFPLHVLFPFDDTDHLPDMRTLATVARLVMDELRDCRTVLVHCNAGQNRSGLVIAKVLALQGYTGILALIQRAHPEALANPVFNEYVSGLG